MTDIVERLRDRRAYVGRVTLEVMADAIAEIERLRAALSRADAAEIAALKARMGELEAKLAKATPWEQICRRCGIRDSWKPDNDPQF